MGWAPPGGRDECTLDIYVCCMRGHDIYHFIEEFVHEARIPTAALYSQTLPSKLAALLIVTLGL